MLRSRCLRSLLIPLAFAVLLSCQPGPTLHSPFVRFRGQAALGSVPPESTRTVAAARGVSTVDSIMAVLFLGNSFGGLEYTKFIPVASDGTFSVEMPRDEAENVILVLRDSSKSRHDQLAGYVAVSDLEESLIVFPFAEAQDEVDLGTLTPVGDSWVSTMSIEDLSVSLSVDVAYLRDLARVDDALKLLRNLYVNASDDLSTFSSKALLTVSFGGPMCDRDGARSDPAQFTFERFGVRFSSSESFGTTFDRLVSGADVIDIYPPSTVTDGDARFGVTAPASTCDLGTPWPGDDGDVLYANAPGLCVAGRQSDDSLEISVAFDAPASFPTGDWLVKLNGEIYSVYRFDYSYPYDSGGDFRVPVPSTAMRVSGDGAVSRLDVRWMKYDAATAAFVPIDSTDIAGGIVTITHSQGASYVSLLDLSDAVLTPSDYGEWVLGADDRISISCRIWGLDYCFDFRAQ
jgi:hypothetical protein